jgi:hypothetical protein
MLLVADRHMELSIRLIGWIDAIDKNFKIWLSCKLFAIIAD